MKRTGQAPRPAPSRGDASELPTDPATGAPRPPMEQPGYYAGFSTLEQKKYWDAATRHVVEERVAKYSGGSSPAAPRFFTAAEAALLRAVVARVLPQSDRVPERRIRIFEYIDDRLAEGRIDGQRYENMPPDGDAYRQALAGLAEMSRQRHGCDFTALSGAEQDLLLQEVHEGQPMGAEGIWRRLPAKRFWKMLINDCTHAYYSHPWAWDEIGYGGPAYPRAYTRLERGEAEPWERDEHRYSWRAPDDSRSDRS